MKLVLASMKDVAAKNIYERLLENYDFETSAGAQNSHVCGDVVLMKIETESVTMRELPVKTEEVIVASRHASESGRPSLTTHTPGYLDRGEMAVASPGTVKAALLELVNAREELGLQHEVSLEATHHGPVQFNVPVTFVEIGSMPEQWRDEKAGEAAARAIMTAAEKPVECKRAVAVGGIHYAPLHTKVVLQTGVGVGHLLPKYAGINEAMIEKAITRTFGKVDMLLLDWKGATSEQRAACKKISEKLGVAVVRAGDLISGKP